MPAERHVPMRRCVVCRTSHPKERLVRFVKGDDGEWRLDAQGRAAGRGTWICTDCAHGADAKRIARGFRGRPDAVIDQLRSHFEEARPSTKHHPRPMNSGGNHG